MINLSTLPFANKLNLALLLDTETFFNDAPFETFTVTLLSVMSKELPLAFSVYLVRFLIAIFENLPLFVMRVLEALITSFLS